MNNIINGLTWIGSKFGSNEAMQVSKKDGQQQVSLSILSAVRLYHLAHTMKNHNVYWISILPLIPGTLILINKSLAKVSYLNHSHCFASLSSKVDKTCRAILQESDKFCYTAELVSSVALIYFGQRVEATFILISLVIISLKNRCLIPLKIDAMMKPLTIFSSLWTVYSINSLILRLFYFWGFFIEVTQHLKIGLVKCEKYINPIFKNRRTARDADLFMNDLNDLDQRHLNLTINPLSIFSPLVDQVPVNPKDVTNEEITQLFEKLDERIERENLFLNQQSDKENLVAGLEKIKQGMLTGKVDDKIPDNFEFFRQLMYTLLESILSNENDFDKRILEVAVIGNNCVEGWSRETSLLLDTKIKEMEWAVHHSLSKLRGNIIAETLCRQPQVEGGTNATHLQKQFQRATVGIFRPFQGILDKQLNAFSFLEFVGQWSLSQVFKKKQPFLNEQNLQRQTEQISRLDRLKQQKLDELERLSRNSGSFNAIWKLAKEKADIDNMRQRILTQDEETKKQAISTITITVLGQIATTKVNWQIIGRINGFSKAIVEKISGYFNDPEAIVDHLHYAIKPRYEPDKSGRYIVVRDIPLDAIRNWQARMSEKYPEIDFSSDSFIEKDGQNEIYLSKRAIYFLLWDMGILDVKEDLVP